MVAVWIALAALTVLVAAGCAALIAVHFGYQKTFGRRADRTSPGLRDRTVGEFPGLSFEPASFSFEGICLRGGRYFTAVSNGRRVAFAHGMGAGHEAYLTEIARLCRAGYEVVAFDFPGCVRSDGKCVGGFHRSLAPFLAGIRFAERTWGQKPLFLMGHSWGGYTVSACAAESGARGVVEIAGFTDPFAEFRAMFPPVLSWILCVYLALRFGKRANAGAALSDVPTLAVHGTADRVVPLSAAVASLRLPSVEPLLCEGKGHNPYLTAAAEAYLNETLAAAAKLQAAPTSERAAFFDGIDYDRATEEDPAVMERILAFLDRH